MILLMWRTTARLGAIRSLDLADIYLEDDHLDRFRYQEDLNVAGDLIKEILKDFETPFLYFRHRPPQTPLMNGPAGERPVDLSEGVGEVIGNYIEVNRVDLTDYEDRQPLLTSEKGRGARISKSGLRNREYLLTQPCRLCGDRPHNREIENWEAREHGKGSRCPSSRSPHRVRTGSIIWHRDRGWPPEILAEKANTSVAMINDVYDQPEILKRITSRRSYLDKLNS